MRLILLALGLLFLTPDAAQAGPVAALVGAVSSWFAGLSPFVAGLIRIGLSLGASLLAQALAPKQKQPGMQIPGTSVGESQSQTFILGVFATGGHLVYRNSFGTAGKTPRAFLTHVIELSDIPGVTLSGLIINDKYAEIGDVAHPQFGFPLLNFRANGSDFAWIKFYDGTQTTADAYLVGEYGTRDDGYQWTANHIGTGISYAILTFRYSREVFQQVPTATFILGGIPLYDPRKDTTVGGDGAHRADDVSTWEPSANSAVQNYNILRGIPMPTGEIYGGDIDAGDLPLANAVAAMNICDTLIGDRPQFRSGLEVRVAEDQPADVIDRINRGSLGQISEIGGVFRMRFGAPAASIYSFADDDISISDPQALNPIKGLDATYNGIAGSYIEPADLWQARQTTPLFNPAWEAEDGDRRLVADVQFDTVISEAQALQVQAAMIADERRQRQHQLVFPPDAQILEPLDDVAWTSEANGYIAKDFEVASFTFRARTGMVAVVCRERDPDDYDWMPAQDPLPRPPYIPLPPQPEQVVPDWAITGFTLVDGDGSPRRPAIRLSWDGEDQDDIEFLRWQIRLTASGVVIAHGVAAVEDGQIEISDGILAATGYQGRGQFVVDRPTDWSDWLNATTPDVRFTQADMDDALRAEFDAARALIDGTVADIDGVVGELRDLVGEVIAPIVGPDLPSVPHIQRIDQGLIDEAQARADAISAEAQARSDAIAAEALARAQAIAAEAQARLADVTQLGDEITAESQARTSAVQGLADEIAQGNEQRVTDTLTLSGGIRDVRDRIQRSANELTDLASFEHLEREGIRTTLRVEVNAARAEYTQAINVLAGEQTALAQQVVTLETATGDLSAEITTVDSARVDGDDALAAQIALLSVGSAVQFDHISIWYWDDSVEGWSGDPSAPTVTADGWLAPASDSYVISPAGLSISTQAYRQVRARLRGEPVLWGDAYLYWAAQGEAWDSARRVVIAAPDWADDEALLTINPDWSGVVDQVRLDLPDGVEIDWLAIGRPAPGASSADIAAERQARIAQGLALAGDLSTLSAELTDVEGLVSGNAGAIDAITVRVEETEDGIVTLSAAQTALFGQVEDLDTGQSALGDAVDLLEVRTETLEGGISVQSESVRAVRSTLRLMGNQALDGIAASLLRDQDALDVIAAASQTLNTRIDMTDGQIAIVAEAVTLLQAAIPGLAAAGALQALTTRVDVTEDEITALSASLLTLSSEVGDVAADLAQNYYTQAQTDGEISTAIANASLLLQSEIDGVATTLAQDYYTRVQTDGEISDAVTAASLALQAQIAGVDQNVTALSATLTQDYYTSAQTDGQITAATSSLQTSLESQIGLVDTDLATLGAAIVENYYTRAQTDGEISTALSGLETQLQSDITDLGTGLSALSATLTQNYYTRAETDGEISSAVSTAATTLGSQIDGVAADLALNYYTSTQTDGEISGAVSAAVTTLNSRLDDPETGLDASAQAIDGLETRAEALEGGAVVQSASTRAVRSTQRLLGNQALDGLAASMLRDQTGLEVIAAAAQTLNSRIDLTDDQVAIVAEAVTLLQAAIPGLVTVNALQALTTWVDVTEGDITALASAVTDLQATIPDLATASALQSLDTRVEATEGTLTTQASQLTSLETALTAAEGGIVGNAGAITSLTATLDQQGNEIQSVSGAVTSLTNRVTTAEGDITTQAGALQTLTSRVTAAEGVNTSQSQAITSLESDISDAQTGVSGNASAISGLTTTVTQQGNEITAISNDVTQLESGLTSANGDIAGNTTALGGLTTTVTQQGTTISAVSDNVTQLQSGLTAAEGDISTQAGALSGLTARVTTAEEGITSLSGDLTTLENSLSSLDGTVTASAGAIDSLQTTVTQQGNTQTAQAQQITDLFSNVAANTSGIFVEQFARTDADNALAAQISTLTSTVGVNTASIDTLASTRVTAAEAVAAVNTEISAEFESLTALAEATAFAQANAEGTSTGFVWSLLGLDVIQAVAVQPNGQPDPNVALRFAGNQIILDGNVQVTDAFQVGGVGTGERAVTTKDGLRVYDANNVARVIIGKLD